MTYAPLPFRPVAGAESPRSRRMPRQQVREDLVAMSCEGDLDSLGYPSKRNQFLAHYRLQPGNSFFVPRELVVILTIQGDQVRQVRQQSEEVDASNFVG